MGLLGVPSADFMRAGNPSDPRAIRTRRLLLDAYEHQIESGDEPPTVSSLVREAGVSRSSFYSHFRGIEDVGVAALRSVLDELGTATTDPLPAQSTADDSGVGFEALFAVFERHRGVCAAVLVTEQGNPALAELHDALVAHISEAIEHLPGKPANITSAQVAAFVVGGLMALIVEWLRGDDHSPADLASVVSQMLPPWLSASGVLATAIRVTP